MSNWRWVLGSTKERPLNEQAEHAYAVKPLKTPKRWRKVWKQSCRKSAQVSLGQTALRARLGFLPGLSTWSVSGHAGVADMSGPMPAAFTEVSLAGDPGAIQKEQLNVVSDISRLLAVIFCCKERLQNGSAVSCPGLRQLQLSSTGTMPMETCEGRTSRRFCSAGCLLEDKTLGY